MSTNIRHEATAAMITQDEIDASTGIQAFLKDLTEEQRRRFTELAHHLVHTGLETGLSRTGAAGPTIEQKAMILVRETELYQAGFAACRTYEGLDEA